ncbi:hypothetical protein CDAR_585171 [Caerostris darwini]|uniref:Uncharacterized protein n=1 Tax=Caerostris darwini TaxID=1538125 RepID=A0AAV4T2S1_9ARAC|nr:hypothetical protein CDAR_585171 [Caerostris darwini]
MEEVKHSGIALNRNHINNKESVFCGYDKICRDKESRGIASGMRFLLFRISLPRRDAEDYAAIFVSIRLMKLLPLQNDQVVSRKGSSGLDFIYRWLLFSYDWTSKFVFEKDHDDAEVRFSLE